MSLSSDGTRVAIGALYNDANGSSSGHVRIYDLNGTEWTQVGQDIDGEAAGDNSGHSVSLSSDGNRVAIGARYDGNGSNSGHVRIYDLSGSAWTQVGQDIDGEAAGDNSGYSVSLSSDGTRVAIGALYNDANGSNSGHVRIYDWNGTEWTQVGQDIDGEAADDYSGFSVSLSSDGNRVAIGANANDANGSNSGHVRIYNLQPSLLDIINLEIAKGNSLAAIYNHSENRLTISQLHDAGITIQQLHDAGINDNQAPSITISGESIMTVEVGSTYTDAGATATDNLDTSVTVTPTSTVNTSVIGNYTVTYDATDNANNQATPAIRTVNVVPVGHAPVCFLAGTPIQTNQGQIPIEKLNPKIHTIRGKPIVAITKTITPDDSLICFEANSLGNHLPSQKTVISMNHKILYQGKMTKAKYFTGNAGIYKISYKQETLYNVLLETHNKMIVNNVICETLDPRNTIAQLYMSLKTIPEEKHASVFSQYNAFCKVHNIYGTDSSRPKSKGAAFRPKL